MLDRYFEALKNNNIDDSNIPDRDKNSNMRQQLVRQI